MVSGVSVRREYMRVPTVLKNAQRLRQKRTQKREQEQKPGCASEDALGYPHAGGDGAQDSSLDTPSAPPHCLSSSRPTFITLSPITSTQEAHLPTQVTSVHAKSPPPTPMKWPPQSPLTAADSSLSIWKSQHDTSLPKSSQEFSWWLR